LKRGGNSISSIIYSQKDEIWSVFNHINIKRLTAGKFSPLRWREKGPACIPTVCKPVGRVGQKIASPAYVGLKSGFDI